jgi:hypothetical protein
MYSSELKPLVPGLPASTRPSFASDLQAGVDIRQLAPGWDMQEFAEMGIQAPQGDGHTIANFPYHVKLVIGMVHVLAACICLSTIMDQFNGTLFSWHPILMTVGFVGLMAEGIILAINFRHLEGPRRVSAIQTHALVQLAAASSVLVAFWAIWKNKVRLAWPPWIARCLFSMKCMMHALTGFRLGNYDMFIILWLTIERSNVWCFPNILPLTGIKE